MAEFELLVVAAGRGPQCGALFSQDDERSPYRVLQRVITPLARRPVGTLTPGVKVLAMGDNGGDPRPVGSRGAGQGLPSPAEGAHPVHFGYRATRARFGHLFGSPAGYEGRLGDPEEATRYLRDVQSAAQTVPGPGTAPVSK